MTGGRFEKISSGREGGHCLPAIRPGAAPTDRVTPGGPSRADGIYRCTRDDTIDTNDATPVRGRALLNCFRWPADPNKYYANATENGQTASETIPSKHDTRDNFNVRPSKRELHKRLVPFVSGCTAIVRGRVKTRTDGKDEKKKENYI